MTDIYKFAAQNALRFPTAKGDLTAEQLFHLPLKSKNGADLDTLAKAINNELKGASEESFVEDTSADPRKKSLTMALDIVKDVIATKQAENRAAADRANKAVQRKLILDAMSTRRGADLSAASMQDLEKKLAELDA